MDAVLPGLGCGAQGPLLPRVLRDTPDETVDCLVIIVFLATATTAVLDIAQEPAGPRVSMVL